MHKFRTNDGKTWVIAIHVSAIKRVRALVGVDLYSLIDDKMAGLAKLLADPVTLVDVLYALVKDDADRQNVTDEDFGRSIFGDAIEEATTAFMAALVDFFPDPRVRATLTKAFTTGRSIQDKLLGIVDLELDKIDPDSVARTLSGLSGNAPGSSGSTPVPSRSEN